MDDKCPKCGQNRTAYEDELCWICSGYDSPTECNMANQIAHLREQLAALADDAFAARIASQCLDPLHRDAYCRTCSDRSDGIGAYREALKAAAAKAKEQAHVR